MKRKTIIATNNTLRDIVIQEIKKYGKNADLNHIDTSQVTNMRFVFLILHFMAILVNGILLMSIT